MSPDLGDILFLDVLVFSRIIGVFPSPPGGDIGKMMPPEGPSVSCRVGRGIPSDGLGEEEDYGSG